jgi:hypothetical protein
MVLKTFLSTLAACALTASAAFAQTNYTAMLIPDSLPRDGSVTVAGFPFVGLPFVSAPLPQPVPVKIPAGWGNLILLGYCNGAEVGYVTQTQEVVGGASGGSQFSLPTHAALFSAPFYDFNDLHNSMNFDSASACDGNIQVGTISNGSGVSHAVMWFGSARSQVDLHNGPYLSTAMGSLNAATNTQVGGGTLDKLIVNGVETKRLQSHALLWHGTVKSLTDIHPTGWLDSSAAQFGPSKQVGYADKFDANQNFITNAFVWSGTAASAINLHQFVPAGYPCSQAYFMDVQTGVISGQVSDCFREVVPALWIPAK